jgi:hypothetical protein
LILICALTAAAAAVLIFISALMAAALR